MLSTKSRRRCTSSKSAPTASRIGRTEAADANLPAASATLQIDYTALSLAAPEKVHFKYKLEGQDRDWKEVVNDRQAQYSNLAPRKYRFRVIACNNSGVWNETGDSLEFSIAPAFYQTNWFRALCAAAFLALLWVAYQFRLRQLQREFNMRHRGARRMSARASRANCTTRCCRAFRG